MSRPKSPEQQALEQRLETLSKYLDSDSENCHLIEETINILMQLQRFDQAHELIHAPCNCNPTSQTFDINWHHCLCIRANTQKPSPFFTHC